METGAWTGSVVWSSNGRLVAMTTQEKWIKARAHLNWMAEHLEDTQGLENKKFKSIRGFLVYVARTYTSMVPYLKGIHATIPDPEINGRTDTRSQRWNKNLGYRVWNQTNQLLFFPCLGYGQISKACWN